MNVYVFSISSKLYDDIEKWSFNFFYWLNQLCASWTLVFVQKYEPKNALYSFKYKLNALSYSKNILDARALRHKNGSYYNLYSLSLSTMAMIMQFHALNSKKLFKHHENQHHLHVCQIVNIFNSINVNFLQFLCTTI